MKKKWLRLSLLTFIILTVFTFTLSIKASDVWFEEDVAFLGAAGKRTVNSVLKIIGPKWRPKYKKLFKRKDCDYPPQKLILINVKNEDDLELWALDKNKKWRYIKTFPIYHASGVAGPKLRQGDKQVPEGIYNIVWLHPNSAWHLSMKIGYPNKFDKVMGKRDKRTSLGGDIFIHGNYYSEGCLAMGDQQIEELFLLVADVGIENVKLISMPYDFRKHKKPPGSLKTLGNKIPKWQPDLYKNIKAELRLFEQGI